MTLSGLREQICALETKLRQRIGASRAQSIIAQIVAEHPALQPKLRRPHSRERKTFLKPYATRNRARRTSECDLCTDTAYCSATCFQTATGINDARVPRFMLERDLHNWFVQNFFLFGFTEVCVKSQLYPDVIMLDAHGRVWRIEVELDVRTFKAHAEYAHACDLIFCQTSNRESVGRIPVMCLYERRNGQTWPSRWLRIMLEAGDSLLSSFGHSSSVEDTLGSSNESS